MHTTTGMPTIINIPKIIAAITPPIKKNKSEFCKRAEKSLSLNERRCGINFYELF